MQKRSLTSAVKKVIREFTAGLKANGFKKTIAQYGWKVFAAVFFYYLVRDVVLYILIPIWGARVLLK